MKLFWRYFLIFFVAGVFTILYFLKTDMGHQNLGYFIENYLSKKTFNKIKVYSLNLENYPELIINLQVNNRAKITLTGKIDNYSIDMMYHLRGDSFTFNNFILKDKIDVKGKLTGTFDHLKVTGEGELFDGSVEYDFLNTPKTIQNLTLKMYKVKSAKVLNFLEEKPLLEGLADININFQHFSSYSKEGRVKIHINRAVTPELKEHVVMLNSTIDFKDIKYYYHGDITSERFGKIIFNNGIYHESKHIARLDYTGYFKGLSSLEKGVKSNYKGNLDLNGTLMYNSTYEDLIITGNTQQFKGNFSFFYRKNIIDFQLKKVSLSHLLNTLSYPIIFTSDIDGTMHVDVKDKIVIINTDLKNTHFVASKFSDTLYHEANINILSGTYNQSHFSAGYQNLKFSASLKIDNGKHYIELGETRIDILTGRINSKFEINMQGKEIFGEIYGSLRKPKFLIDKRKFIHFQTNKYISDWLGTNK
jgi:hypothetical protein